MDDEKGKAERAVDLIIDDLTDRKGFGQVWDETDKKIQADIREKWERLIAKVYAEVEDVD